MSSPLLIELLHIIYHTAERNASIALQALNDVMERATYELYTGNITYIPIVSFTIDVICSETNDQIAGDIL